MLPRLSLALLGMKALLAASCGQQIGGLDIGCPYACGASRCYPGREGGRRIETKSCVPGSSLPPALVPRRLPSRGAGSPGTESPRGVVSRLQAWPASLSSSLPGFPSPTPTQRSCPRPNKQSIVPLGVRTGSLQAGAQSRLFPGPLSSHPAGHNPLPQPTFLPHPWVESGGPRQSSSARLSLPSSFPAESTPRSSWHILRPPNLTQACKASLLGPAWMI